MTMRITHLNRDCYTMRRGYDPTLDLDLLVRTYDDGTETISARPGNGDTTATWGPEVALGEAVMAS